MESLAVQIATRLVDRMREGTLQAGMQLPSEPKLARMFQVSRNTVREAIQMLIARGLLESRHGIGTFVRDTHPPAWPVDTGIEELTSTTEMIRRAGHVPGCRGYHLEIVNPPDGARGALSLGRDTRVYHVSRIRLADEQPVMVCDDFLPTDLVDASTMQLFTGAGSLFSFLAEHCGLSVLVASTVIAPVNPSTRVAKSLDITTKAPLLLLKQTHYDPENQPFLYSENHINPTFMTFHVRRTPRAAGTATELRPIE